jgi:DNA modification methylase
LKTFPDESIDTMITDPPYGYAFMNKSWDKVVIGVETWKECLRVLKPGSFAAVMSSPRQDVLSRMICNLQDAGFRTDFSSIYWTYASGFPKAANVSKLVDKRIRGDMIRKKIKYFMDWKGETINSLSFKINLPDAKKTLWDWLEDGHNPSEKSWTIIKNVLNVSNEEEKQFERKIIGQKNKLDTFSDLGYSPGVGEYSKTTINYTESATDKAKELDGSYAGYQPKPAVEVILIVMKPLSEKSYVDQALKNGKGVTWLDDCRIPFYIKTDDQPRIREGKICSDNGQESIYGKYNPKSSEYFNTKGRFPANLLVENDVLNDGKITKSKQVKFEKGSLKFGGIYNNGKNYYNTKNFTSGFNDSGSFSRYFSLDSWFDTTFPFIITPKASPSERHKGLDNWIPEKVNDGRKTEIDNPFQRGETLRKNTHPTCKPIKLMSYLITLLSREGNIVLDPFLGSGTTAIASKLLNRSYIGIEKEKEYINISQQRIKSYVFSPSI